MSRLYIDAILQEFEGVGSNGYPDQVFTVPSGTVMRWIQETGNTTMRDDAWLIPDVCKRPSSIWKDRAGNGFVYAGYPGCDFSREYGQGVFDIPTDKLFLVFVNGIFEVTFFEWTMPSSGDDRFPSDYAERFEVLIWPVD